MAGKKNMLSKRGTQYWVNKGFSKEDAEIERRKYQPGKIEYYVFFHGKSNEEAKLCVEEWRKKLNNTENNFISRYGEEMGKQKWKEYCEKQSIKNTFEYKKDKFGWNKKQFDDYNKSRSVTLPNLIKRYGEEMGKQKWKEYCELQVHTKSLEYFIEKFGEIEGTKKWNKINFLKSHTYESYLERFNGDKEKATEFLNLFYSKHRTSTSKVSIEFFDKIRDRLDKMGYKQYYYFPFNQEWYFKCNQSFYKVDFFLKDTGKIIEFFGDYWHANPKIYNENDKLNSCFGNFKTVKELWEYDDNRIKNLKNVDYVKGIMIVWESDFYKDEEKVIESCIKFLTE